MKTRVGAVKVVNLETRTEVVLFCQFILFGHRVLSSLQFCPRLAYVPDLSFSELGSGTKAIPSTLDKGLDKNARDLWLYLQILRPYLISSLLFFLDWHHFREIL